MSSYVSAVIAYWDAHGVSYLPGVGGDALRAFETNFGVRMPEDMRCFYETTNGTHVPLGVGQDHESYDFYPLSEIVPDSAHDWAFNFADYREVSWLYAVDLTGAGGLGSGAVYLLGAVGGKPLIVARSFGEFLDLYVHSDRRLTPPGASAYHKSIVGEG